MGQRPKEAVAERWAVAFEEKANDFAVWVLDILGCLGLKYKDQEVQAVKCHCGKGFVQMSVPTTS